MRKRWIGIALVGVFACENASKPVVTPSAPTTASDAAAHAKAADGPPSKYQEGDYVVYRYNGTFTREPVMLREQIIERNHNRLIIRVSAQRAGERRDWLQVVTDTPENQQNNVVDELYLLSAGEKTKLANRNNEDLLGLYSWTLIRPDGKPESVQKDQVAITFFGQFFSCERTLGFQKVNGRLFRFESHECPSFVWSHGPVRYWEEKSGEQLLHVQVQSFGREPSCDYASPTCGDGSRCAFTEVGSSCVPIVDHEPKIRIPFRRSMRFRCIQGPHGKPGSPHSFRPDVLAIDLENPATERTVDVLSPISGEVFVFDQCNERATAPTAQSESRCGSGYGNHVKIWDGKVMVLLGHLARVKVKSGAKVRAGDVIGVEGASGGAKSRHVHLQVSRPHPTEDAKATLRQPALAASLPTRAKFDVKGNKSIETIWSDQLECNMSAPEYVTP